MSNTLFLPDQPTSDDADIAPKQHVTVFGGKVYLTRKQVPLHYPISEHTLAMLASKGRGPRFFKPTDKALYLPADIESWIEASAVIPIADPLGRTACAPARLPREQLNTGRGRAVPKPKREDAAAPSGRRLKSLPTTPESWL